MDRVNLADAKAHLSELVERLMGKNPEHRFNFIQNNAASVGDDVIDA